MESSHISNFDTPLSLTQLHNLLVHLSLVPTSSAHNGRSVKAAELSATLIEAIIRAAQESVKSENTKKKTVNLTQFLTFMESLYEGHNYADYLRFKSYLRRREDSRLA